MSSVTRLFDHHEQAMEAVAELKRDGFSDESITVVAPAEGHAAEGEPATRANDAVLASLMQADVPRASAEAYADGVRRGGTAVSVRPLFGFASAATAILDRFNPTDLGPAVDSSLAGSADRPAYDPAAPLSSTAGWPVLSDNPTPLSSWLKWRVLSERQTPSITLSDKPAPLSQRIGLKVLSERQTPSVTLSDNPTPLSSRLGWRLLSRDPAPLSTWRRWRLLLNDPAPLSSWLGWRLLLDNPAPLSSWLGWRMLTKD